MDLDLRRVRYFLVTAEAGKITRAAEQLHITQPALTQALHLLERELGASLFLRRHAGVELTAAGERFRDRAVLLMEAADQAARSVRSPRGHTKPLVIGVHGRPWRQVRSIIDNFRAVSPGVSVVERSLGLVTQEYALVQGQVDAVFNVGVPDDGRFVVQHLRDEPRRVAVPNRHMLAESASLRVQDVIDQRYVSVHPAVPAWSGDVLTLASERGGRGHLSGHQAGSAEELVSALADNLFACAAAETAGFIHSQAWRWRSVDGLGTVSLDLVTDARNPHPDLPTLRAVAAWT